MPTEENASVISEISEKIKYETNLLRIEEKNYQSNLYKVRIYLNDESYDLCVAIGDEKTDKPNVNYKYVYAIKYRMPEKKIGLFEYMKDQSPGKYILLFD